MDKLTTYMAAYANTVIADVALRDAARDALESGLGRDDLAAARKVVDTARDHP